MFCALQIYTNFMAVRLPFFKFLCAQTYIKRVITLDKLRLEEERKKF